MYASWQWRRMQNMRDIADTKLKKLFVFPAFKFVLPDKPIYHELNLEKYTTVEYGKQKPMHCIYHVDLTRNSTVYAEKCAFDIVPGGCSYSTFGNSFMYDAKTAAYQTAFWLPLEMFCVLSEQYAAFSKCCIFSVRIEKDKIPMKTKRIWFKHYIAELKKQHS
jgi:hypothetical protein